jgi:hypothetical protein
MRGFVITFIILLGLKLSYSQTWDAEDWGNDIEKAVMVNDTFNFNGFRIVDERWVDHKFRSLDTLYEEYYRPLHIELVNGNSDSTIVLKSGAEDLYIRRNHKGFEIKAKLGGKTAVLYVGELMNLDTFWLDTLAFKVLPIERLTSFSHLDSICVSMLVHNQELFGGLGRDMCTYHVPCIITAFKIKIKGQNIKAKFIVNGSVLPKEAIESFKKLKTGDVVTFYDINGITRMYQSKIEFEPRRLIIKPCEK